ncbi:MAG: heparan-alpha-glucosaminide N-acetyltransferase domain-containing protein [Propionibacteriaceae bacterium]
MPSGATTTKQRLLGIDVSRGLALLGMMAVHALIPYDEDYNPNWVTYIPTGHASGVFALLAGVGLSLTTGRAVVPRSNASTTVAGIAGRAAAIGVVGLLLGYTSATIAGVILPYYAVMFLLAIPLLFLRTRILVGVGIFVAVAVPVLSELVRPALPEATLENLAFSYLFDHPLHLLSELLVTGAYPGVPWVSYICTGLIVGRLTLSSVHVARRMLIFGVALGLAATTASWWLLGPLGGRAALRLAVPGPLNSEGDTVDDLLVFGFEGTTPTGNWWWLATSAPHAATPLDLLHTIGTALAVVGAMLLLGHVTAPALRRVIHLFTAPLAAAGSMTLTLYTAHVVFMNSPLDQFTPMGGYIFQVVAVLLFALGWRQAVGRGPLETAVTAVANRAKARAARGHGAGRAPSTVHAPSHPPPQEEARARRDETGRLADRSSPAFQAQGPRRALSPVDGGPRRGRRPTADRRSRQRGPKSPQPTP